MVALRVCAEPGCPELAAVRRCPDHTREADRARGTRQQRGYDRRHELLREQWRPKVERGEVDCAAVVCLMAIRRILPGQQWQLDHDDDRSKYRGPAHKRCNLSAGGKAAHSA